jgi:hypothetical protein
MTLSGNRRGSFLGIIGLALLLTAFLAGCSKGTKEATEQTEPKVGEAQAQVNLDEIRADDLKPVLGEARDDQSGVVDCTNAEDVFIIDYRYYDSDLQNIDQDMVTEMAPKIQALYKKYPNIDRVRFQIQINSTTPGEWRPYVSFVITREIYERTVWSGVMAEDFLQNMLELQRFR